MKRVAPALTLAVIALAIVLPRAADAFRPSAGAGAPGGLRGQGRVGSMRARLDGLIKQSGADVAVAFRTLDGRDELLIQPDVEYHAASTMKVPVMIELFRQVRAGALSLDDQLSVVNAFHSIVDGSVFTLDEGADSDSAVYKRVGARMSYRELCEAMITVSSNLATDLLIERLGAKRIQATTDALGATGMRVLRGVEDDKAFQKGLNNTTTARALMTLMEKIAKGEAVDQASSEQMVAVLKRQQFNDRIPAGVPPDVPVAHKTGEITRIQHDAAIVYGDRPFVLIVLVRGLQDANAGAALAASIARELYDASQPPRTADPKIPATAKSDRGQASRTADSAAQLLSELIRVDSSNPPGRNGAINDLLAGRLRPLGFDIEIIPTPDAGKSHLVARLHGDGSKKPVLIAAHGDVVGVERDKWSLDPFAGAIKDGHVYGRGAVDFKGGVAVFARAVMMLAERKVPLARDVIFLSEADEEGAAYNTYWLARDHWKSMDCAFALNEGGWIIKDDGGKVKYVSISTADKGSISLVLTAHGTSTHSSMPLPDNAIFMLSRAMTKLAEHETRIQMTPATRQFFMTLAKTSQPPRSDAYRTIATSDDAVELARANREVSQDPLLHALIRNTIAPVLMNAGFRGNVIPGSAEATINVRTVPGTRREDLIKEFVETIDDPRVEVTLAPGGGLEASEPSPLETDLYRAIDHQARATFPGTEVTPYLFQAGTDAGAWRSRGVPVYGIYPYAITADELSRMHGNDERVGVDALGQGVDLIYKTLVEVAGKGR
jgi:acetylornithine deacetylase/succinyl-diaminopimelate desuccinylase-like protein/beta-lactamase class A